MGTRRHEGESPVLIGFAMFAFGFQTTAIWREEFGSVLDQVYCTPEQCLSVPQILTGCAVAAAPVIVSIWHRQAAIYLGLFLAGLMGMLLIATGQDGYLWVLPTAFFTALIIGITALLLLRTPARNA
ncbi:hypothetical protein [Lentzea sp. NPDC051838]|uniref:hypothetical protein n=1 Tax=Lentzea sp. NPDC051838 TaxID=3154849 RepID=UPI00343C6072